MSARNLVQRIVKDLAKTITLDVIRDGKQIVPDASPTVSLFRAGDGTATTISVVDAVATIATSGQLSFAVVAGNTDIEGLYRAEWKFKISTVDHTQDSFYRVVKSVSDQLVTLKDVIQELPRLANIKFEDVTWEDFIDARWNKMQREARMRGIYDWLVLRDEDLYYIHLYQVMLDAVMNFKEEEGDVYDELMKD